MGINSFDNFPKISLIILNAFKTENLQECLDSLKNTDYSNYEIIVIDCLTEGIEEFINKNFPNVNLVSLNEDIGPAAMHNVGVENADPVSKFIVFLDNDVIVDKNWLKELFFCIIQNERIGAVQSKILLYNQPDLYNTRGNKANFLAVGWPDGYNTPDERDIRIRKISFPSGACMIVRRSALEHVGGYDPDYFIYADDMDTGLRMMISGYEILYCPKSIIYHKYKFLKNPRNFYFLNRNRIYTYLKLYDKRTYVLLIPPYMFYEFSLFIYALQNNFLMQLMKAYIYNLKNIQIIRRKRGDIQHFKVLSDKEIVSNLEGRIDFPEISNHIAVKKILNPFLEKYRHFLIGRLN